MKTDAKAAPDVAKLNGYQVNGWSCALCGSRLYADRSLGTFVFVRAGHRYSVELWACDPPCRS
ncbi:hypothetical protein ABZV77_03900 [Streptomyces sp. NPDC004732]|uniref:hypothetical protein n=1 Tax=Streptomyces sp. NPDC004732 TaxID=3154290 RepID=UPI0033A0BB39